MGKTYLLNQEWKTKSRVGCCATQALHAPAGRAFFFGGAQKRSKKGRLVHEPRPRFHRRESDPRCRLSLCEGSASLRCRENETPPGAWSASRPLETGAAAGRCLGVGLIRRLISQVVRECLTPFGLGLSQQATAVTAHLGAKA